MDFLKERAEAIDAGECALNSLYSAKRHISAAEGFGIWDILGGGSWVSMFKHYKIQRARRALEEAKLDLYKFSRELHDVQMYFDININIFVTFFDLLDNLFADIWVQCSLASAKSNINEVISQVQYCLDELRSMNK